jgi:hypothetical protein
VKQRNSRDRPTVNEILSSKPITAIVGVVVLVCLIGYLSRSWIRTTAFPAAAPIFARHSLSVAMQMGMADLEAAGIVARTGANSGEKVKCSPDEADHFYMLAYCESSTSASLSVGIRSGGGLRQAIERLQSRGWSAGSFDTPYANSITSSANYRTYGLRDYGSAHCQVTMLLTPKDAASNGTYDGSATLYCYRLIADSGQPPPE